jgi:hypothetical protein
LIRFSYLLFFLVLGAHSQRAHTYSSPLPLPKGVRALAFVYGQATDVTGRFNNQGLVENLSHPLNRSVTLEDMAEFEPDLLRLQSFLNDLDPSWGSQLLGANLYANISVFESRKVTGMLYGLTDRFAVGLLIPWIERRVDYGFYADVVNNAGSIATSVGHNPPLQAALEELRSYPLNTQTFTQSIFLNRGYNAPQSQTLTAWGDLEFESRYTYFLRDWLGLGIRARLQMPTTNYKHDIRNILDQDLAENTWGARLTHISELQLWPNVLSWSTLISGMLRAPRQQERAYARSPDEPLPDLNDPYQIENVEKTIGPEFNAESGLMLGLFKGLFNVSGTYFYSRKAEDRIRGQRGLDYERETRGTASESHGYQIAAEFSTFTAFQRNAFFIPLKFSAAYVRPVAGRNTIFAPYWRFDSVVLF